MQLPPEGRFYRFWAKVLISFARIYFKIRITGLEHFPSEGPAIVVANHQSYLDVLLVAAALEEKNLLYQNYWVIGKPTYQNPFLHWLFAKAPVIVVNGTVKKAETVLKGKGTVTIFPEGFYTWRKFRYDHGKEKENPPRRIGNSAAILAIKTGCPIIPVKIQGTLEAMPPYSFFARPGKLSLVIAPPFRFDVPEPEEVTEEMIAEKAGFIMQQVDALG